MRGPSIALCVFLFALAPTIAASPEAFARDANAAAAESGRSAPLPADAIKRLKSGDEARIKSALDDVRMSGRAGAPAVAAIREALERGLPPALTQAAIDTLGDTQSAAATPTLVWYARHRDVAVRRSAVEALARTGGAAAVGALRAALSDPEPTVRGAAAAGLGTLKAKEALGDLFLALDHKVTQASASIGRLCAGDECDRLAAKLGRMPFDVVTGGLEQALARPASDVNDDIKVKIVARVRELGTAEANRFLRGVQARWPKGASARVKQAIDQAVLATSASPGGQEASP